MVKNFYVNYFSSLAWLRLFISASACCFANLLWTTVVWGQSATPTSFPSQKTRNYLDTSFGQLELLSTSAADLLFICNANSSEVNRSSSNFNCESKTEWIVQTDSKVESEDKPINILEPSKDEFRINFGNDDPRAFTFGLGSQLGEPTALQGQSRRKVVSTSAQTLTFFPIQGFIKQGLGAERRILLEFTGDVRAFGLDLSYTFSPQTIPGAFSVNATTQRSFVGVFESGDDVNLPGGADPWVHRSGGGVEYYLPVSRQFSLANGFNYQLVSVRPGAFTSQVESEDELGNRVTVSNDGRDLLLTLNLAGFFTTVDDPGFPSKGLKLQLGIDTSIPVGDANIAFGRLAANYSQFIPLDLFGFSEGARTLILNLQAGTIIGDVPPYEAFSLGGSSSVRGYGGGEVASGSSFILASAEYRYPIVNDLSILLDFDLRGSLFFDYGSDLGTAEDVIGEPAIVRNKEGEGLGYGLGLLAETGFGLLRMEFAMNDNGDFIVHFSGGDRY